MLAALGWGRLRGPSVVLTAVLVLATTSGCSEDNEAPEPTLADGLVEDYLYPVPFRDLRRAAYHQVSDCMDAQGLTLLDQLAESPADDAVPMHASAEVWQAYARRWGFGIGAEIRMSSLAEADHEAAIVALEDEDETRYRLALWGGGGAPGCYQAGADGAQAAIAAFEGQYADELADLATTVNAEMEERGYAEHWRTCMLDKGYDFESRQTLRDSFSEEYFGLVADQPGLPTAIVDSPVFAEVQAREMAAAVDDVECATPQLDVTREVALEVQAPFVAEHQDELERLRANVIGAIEDAAS